MSDSPVHTNLILSPQRVSWPFWLASTMLHAVPLGLLSLEGTPVAGPIRPLTVDIVYVEPPAAPQARIPVKTKAKARPTPRVAEETSEIMADDSAHAGLNEGQGQLIPHTGNATPEYPEAARTQGIEGKVIVALTVNSHGQVCHAEARPPHAHPLLEEAALATVKKWRFKVVGLQSNKTFVQEFFFDLMGEK